MEDTSDETKPRVEENLDNEDSADEEPTESSIIQLPINMDDEKSFKNITKAQLVNVIKGLTKDIAALKDAKSEIKPTLLNQEDLLKAPVWDSGQIAEFMRSQNAVNNSFKFKLPEPHTDELRPNPFSGMYEKIEYDARNPGTLTHIFKHDKDIPFPRENKILKLDTNTPKFHGNVNEDVDDWLYKVKINLDIAQIPSDKYFDYLTNYCVSKAGTFMRRLRESFDQKFTVLSWPTFRESFIKRYRPFDHVRRIRNQLIQLRQGNDFNSYVDNFQHLLNQVDTKEFSPQEKLHYFTEGLHPDTRFQVVSNRCTSVDHAILIAAEFDSCRSKQVYSVQFAQNKSARQYHQQYHHNRDNQSRFKTHSFSSKKPSPVDIRKQAFKPTTPKPQFVSKLENQKSPIQCSRCKLMGHLASNCRVNLKLKPEKILTAKQEKIMTAIRIFSAIDKPVDLLRINGSVNDIPADLYFDSGATASLISTRFVEANKITVTPSDVQIRSANNSIDEVKGVTPLLTINVAHHLCQLKLLVFDLGDIDVLLGLNWFRATGAGLYPAQQMLKFGEHSIHLNRYTYDNNDDHDVEDLNMVQADDSDLLPVNFEMFSTSSDCIVSETALTTSQQPIFKQLIQFIESSNVFAYKYTDIEGCNLLPHVIETSSDKPIYIPRYRRSNYENDIISVEIDLMLQAKIIQPSSSPYSSSIVLVPKPDGSKRVCVDYRKLNAITFADNFPLPRIQDNLDSLSGSVYFTTFDLFSGYFQTFIDVSSIPKTDFTTANGQHHLVYVMLQANLAV